MTNTMRRIGLGAALLLLVAACSSDDGAETTVSTAASTTTEAATITAAPTSTTTTVPSQGTSCVDCHSDEETLKALAVEPVEEEVLSEGEG